MRSDPARLHAALNSGFNLGIEESLNRPQSPGYPPDEWPFFESDPFDLEKKIREKRMCESWQSLSIPSAAYEGIRYTSLAPEERIEVKTPGGRFRFTKDQMLELAVFPSEIVRACADGPWYSPFPVVPGIAASESVKDRILSLDEFVVPKDLAIRYLKHCCTDDSEFQIRNDGTGGTYTRTDLYILLYASRSRIVTLREGNGLEFCQELAPQMPDEEILKEEIRFLESERVCPQCEAYIKAKRWPHETAEVLTEDGCIEILKGDLTAYAHEPADVKLLGSRWFSVRKDGLPTMERLISELLKMENGQRVSIRTAIDYAKLTGNFDVIFGFMNAGAKLAMGIRKTSPRHPDEPYVEYMVDPGYSR